MGVVMLTTYVQEDDHYRLMSVLWVLVITLRRLHSKKYVQTKSFECRTRVGLIQLRHFKLGIYK